MKLLLATRSRHKAAEIREILADVPDLQLLDLGDAGVRESADEEHLEPYETFEENAVSKARYFFEATGLPPRVAACRGEYRFGTDAEGEDCVAIAAWS